MMRKEYIEPETIVVKLRLGDPILVIGDLFTGSKREDSKDSWAGAKGDFMDDDSEEQSETHFRNLWDE